MTLSFSAPSRLRVGEHVALHEGLFLARESGNCFVLKSLKNMEVLPLEVRFYRRERLFHEERLTRHQYCFYQALESPRFDRFREALAHAEVLLRAREAAHRLGWENG